MSDERVRTHWVGCHREHHACAVRLIEDAAAALEESDKLLTAIFKLMMSDASAMAHGRIADVLARIRGTG